MVAPKRDDLRRAALLELSNELDDLRGFRAAIDVVADEDDRVARFEGREAVEDALETFEISVNVPDDECSSHEADTTTAAVAPGRRSGRSSPLTTASACSTWVLTRSWDAKTWTIVPLRSMTNVARPGKKPSVGRTP